MGETVFRLLAILLIGLCFSSSANATTLTLRSGRTVYGRIIEQNPLHVTMDVSGFPRTYFFGEIALIDGKKIEVPEPQEETQALPQEETQAPPQETSVAIAPADVSPSDAPYDRDEEDSLIRFMNTRGTN